MRNKFMMEIDWCDVFSGIFVITLAILFITAFNKEQNDIQTLIETFHISQEQAEIIYEQVNDKDEIIRYDEYKAININDGRLYKGILHESTYKNAYNHDYIEWEETGKYDPELLQIVQYAKQLRVGDKQ